MLHSPLVPPDLTQLFVLSSSSGGTESISATVGGSATFMHLEEIICIYSLLKKVMQPLARFANDSFFRLVLFWWTKLWLLVQAEPGPPIYLSWSSQMAFAVSSRKRAIKRQQEVIFLFPSLPSWIINISKWMRRVRRLLGQFGVRQIVLK